MALDIGQLKPAQIGTSEIATKNDVSRAIDPLYTPGTTTIDGGHITTNTIDANRIDATTVSASNILVDQTVRSSDFTAVDGAGFRLKSNAAGTSADPTIYGAYIKGGSIEAATLSYDSIRIMADGFPANLGLGYAESNGNATANNAIECYAYSDYFYGRGYGSGFIENRIVGSSQRIYIKGQGTILKSLSASYLNVGTVSLEYAINDATWVSVGTSSGMYNATSINFDLGANYIRFRCKVSWGSTVVGLWANINVTTVAGA